MSSSVRISALILIFFISKSSCISSINLPTFNSFETGALISENVAKSGIEADESSCEERIIMSLMQTLDNYGINLRNNLSDVFNDQKNYGKMCHEYSKQKKSLSECPEPRQFLQKFGVISFLELSCRIMKDVIVQNSECISEMESTQRTSCHHACISKDYKGMDKLMKKDPYLHCDISTCISRCINQQIQECSSNIKLKNLYNELSGIQMLLGVEYIHGSGSRSTMGLVQSNKIPSSCRRFIWKAIIAASNFTGYKTYDENNESNKDDFKSF